MSTTLFPRAPYTFDLTLARRRYVCALLALCLSASVVASPQSKVPAAQTPAAHHWYQIGRATWYGKDFQGRRTSSGERFNMHALTCAHPTLPLGSWLRVTNLGNRRSTFVRVNDRGPYSGRSIVDLSFAAAQSLHFLGTAPVRVEQVRADDPELVRALAGSYTAVGTPISDDN